ncbi:MAG: cytochrome c biogenesis protein ResB [Opitutales bacterium]
MPPFLRTLRDFIVSLQLTVALLFLSLVLVFVATIDQTHLGVWGIQQKWFHSFVVYQDVNGLRLPVYPGGYLIGGLLFFNLIGAHFYRFKFTWNKSGIQLAHAGIILLLCGELISGLTQKDSTVQLEEGQTKNYSESFRDYELALLDKTNPAFDTVVAIPESVLEDKGVIQHPQLPFTVRIKEYYGNAALSMRNGSAAPGNPATAGIGPGILMLPQPLTYKPDETNTPGAYVEIAGPAGTLGTWLVSPLLGAPQTFTDSQNHTWELTMRLRRSYQPFSLTLLQVNHDVYPGTDIPKNFSSRIRLKSDDGRDSREVVIFMNNPLRHGGLTFYQYQMNAASHMTVLQVVRNPGWLLPYVACIMMGLGLCLQFSFSLARFIRKRTATAS